MSTRVMTLYSGDRSLTPPCCGGCLPRDRITGGANPLTTSAHYSLHRGLVTQAVLLSLKRLVHDKKTPPGKGWLHPPATSEAAMTSTYSLQGLNARKLSLMRLDQLAQLIRLCTCQRRNLLSFLVQEKRGRHFDPKLHIGKRSVERGDWLPYVWCTQVFSTNQAEVRLESNKTGSKCSHDPLWQPPSLRLTLDPISLFSFLHSNLTSSTSPANSFAHSTSVGWMSLHGPHLPSGRF